LDDIPRSGVNSAHSPLDIMMEIEGLSVRELLDGFTTIKKRMVSLWGGTILIFTPNLPGILETIGLGG
jgi:hypothetical protein